MFDKERFFKFYEIYEKNDMLFVVRVGADKSKRKSILCNDTPLYFTENFTPTGEEEAKKLVSEGKIQSSTGIEFYKIFMGLSTDELVIKQYGYDTRTKKYIDVVKYNLGLVDEKHGYDEFQYKLLEKSNVFLNASDVEIGLMEDDRYILSYGLQTDIDDYCIFNYIFNKRPQIKDASTLKTLENIESHLFKNHDYKFKCWECGNETHWLDTIEHEKKSLENRLENLKNHYCGC